jgi:hypothetical protein
MVPEVGLAFVLIMHHAVPNQHHIRLLLVPDSLSWP